MNEQPATSVTAGVNDAPVAEQVPKVPGNTKPRVVVPITGHWPGLGAISMEYVFVSPTWATIVDSPIASPLLANTQSLGIVAFTGRIVGARITNAERANNAIMSICLDLI